MTKRLRTLCSRLPAVIAAIIALMYAAAAAAYETDQFTNRTTPIADSTEVLNRKVNETLREIVGGWNKGHDEMAVVDAIYHTLGGHHWVDKLERWAMKSPDVEKLDTPRYGSVFSDMPICAVRVTFFFGIGKTIRVNDQLIGSDKIGHFLSQGRKFYRRFVRYGSEERAAEQSAFTERAIFGRMTTGSYSNADLVANYEGYLFYRSLFEDGIVAGRSAILRWEYDRWVINRKFDWADHVNAYWDEALNINYFDSLLYKPMRAKLVSMCLDYWEYPSLYTVKGEPSLRARYAHLDLWDTSELRGDSLCPLAAMQSGDETPLSPAGIWLPDVLAFP